MLKGEKKKRNATSRNFCNDRNVNFQGLLDSPLEVLIRLDTAVCTEKIIFLSGTEIYLIRELVSITKPFTCAKRDVSVRKQQLYSLVAIAEPLVDLTLIKFRSNLVCQMFVSTTRSSFRTVSQQDTDCCSAKM